MTRWIPVLMVIPLVSAPAQAVTPSPTTVVLADPAPLKPNRLNLRLVQDTIDPQRPVRRSGMIVHTEVAPNTTLGVGILKTAPRKNSSPDWRIDSRAGGSKRAAVTVQFRF